MSFCQNGELLHAKDIIYKLKFYTMMKKQETFGESSYRQVLFHIDKTSSDEHSWKGRVAVVW